MFHLQLKTLEWQLRTSRFGSSPLQHHFCCSAHHAFLQTASMPTHTPYERLLSPLQLHVLAQGCLLAWKAFPTISAWKTSTHHLSPCRVLEQNTTDWVACSQQNSIFHSAGGWEIQDWGAGRFGVGWMLRAPSLVCREHLLTVSSHGGGGKELMPFTRFYPQGLRTSQRSHLLIPPTLGLKIQPMHFGGIHSDPSIHLSKPT